MKADDTSATQQSQQGTFIVLEGTDGAGKATQLQLLANDLQQAGHDVVLFDFPRYDEESSYFVKRYLNGEYGSADAVGPYTGSLFYALDRYDAADQIRAALDGGKVVIVNRYTASNMAHQGTKFHEPAERRGYFIWLDNLEFELLRVPRPHLNVVLRVPAEVSQKLVDQKKARSYTTAKRDLHEADLQHLKRAVEVYDELCQLFPKDFTSIDCVRNNELLDIETIAKMVREKVNPWLPKPKFKQRPETTSPSAKSTSPSEIVIEHPAAEKPDLDTVQSSDSDDDNNSEQLNGVHMVVERASSVLASKLHGMTCGRLTTCIERPFDPATGEYHTPESFDDETADHYGQAMDAAFAAHAELVEALTKYLQENAAHGSTADAARQATAAAEPALPVAALTKVDIYAPEKDLHSLVSQLLADELPEARATGQVLHGDSDNVDTKPATPSTSRAVRKIADELLARTHSDGRQATVTLADTQPRNELDIIADVLYEHANLPLRQLREETTDWTYEQKAAVLEAYTAGQPGSSRALAKIHYGFDLVTDFGLYRAMQRDNLADRATNQALTPRQGYDVPKLIEDAGLTEQFEDCFDKSLALYSYLQQRGYELEAQYATLAGHKLRWNVSYTADTAYDAFSQTNDAVSYPGRSELIAMMRDKVREVHPILTASLIPPETA